MNFFKTQVSFIANSNEDIKTIGKRLKKLVDDAEKPDILVPAATNQESDKNDSTK